MTSGICASTTRQIHIEERLARAHAAWRSGQADEAEIACREVVAIWPGQADAFYLMGLLAYASGNLDRAIAQMRQACHDGRAPPHYLSDFAELCRQSGRLPEGEQAARRAVALAPNFAGAWNNLGIILQEMLKLEESKLCLERVLALEPNSAEALNNLGNTCKRLGLIREAEVRLTSAIKLKPDYAEAYSNLANLLIDQGEYDRAEAMGRKALAINPRFADAYVNLAGVETARRRYREALGWLDALLAFAPVHGRALAARALTLKELDRLDEATQAAESAILATPESPEAHDAQGQVFQAMGQFRRALECFDRAIKLPGPAQRDAISNRALLLAEFGKLAEARTAFEDAARIFPHSAPVLFNLAELRTIAPGDPLIARIEAALAHEGLSVFDRTMLHFGLGKALLDAGDAARAFRHYDEGNRLKRATFAYDADATDRWMSEIAAIFSPDLLEANANLGARSDRPVFVVGMPRSGTTLIEQILASHARVRGAGERMKLQRLANEVHFPTAFRTLPGERLRAIGDAYLGYVAPMAEGRKHVVDKMPANFALAGVIRLILPDARIIHCRRDPADTCLSCYTKLFAGQQAFAYDQTELGRFHRAYQRLTAHWRAILPPSHFLEVDYEALVDDFELQVRRMLDFLELPWDPRVLRFYETERPVRTASSSQVRQPLFRSSAGRSRRYEAQLRPLLAELGGW